MIAEEEQCSLDVEIQSLKAIFAEELEVNRSEDDKETVKRLVLQMSPESAKGENLQFVRFEIVLEIPLEYPQAIPKITLRNVRGLSEEAQARTKEHMICRAEELSGNAMLFELIQVAKELLTSENAPSIPCSICLFSFDTEDSFSRTPCFHFFHTHCLAKHVQHSLALNNSSEDKGPPNDLSKEQEQDVLCPVCRLAIPFEESDPEKFPVPRESLKEEDKVVITPELKKMQEEMAALYSEQLARGSIIDLESEKNKYFIEISNTPDIQVLSSASVSPNLVRQANDAASNDSTNKSSTESGAEHIQKRHDTSSKKSYSSNSGRQSYYDKTNSRFQTRKPGWKNGRSAAEVKEKGKEVLEDIDWCQEAEGTPPSSASKKENRKDMQKTNEEDEAERGDGETSQNTLAGNEDGSKKNYEYQEDYRGKQRRQYNDKKQRSKKDTTGERNQPGGSGGQAPTSDWNQEDSVTQDDNKDHRFNKKKNFRKFKNFDENSSNPDGTGEGASSKGEVLGSDPKDQEGSSNRRNQSSERPGRYGQRNWKNYPRNTDSDYENRPRYFRQNRYNRPYENRYPRDRQGMAAEDGVQENSSAEVNEQVDQNCDTRVQGEYSENRYRNPYSRYKHNFAGQNRTRERSQNNKMGNGANSESKDQGEVQTEESRTQNPKRFFKGGAYRGQRGRYTGRRETSRKESCGSEDNTHPTEVHDEFRERKYETNETNRRFQKSYPNENESSKVIKDTDDAAAAVGDETQEQTGERWARYRNRNDKFKKPSQKLFSEHDNGNVSTTDTQEQTNPNESNAYGSSTHEINAQMGKENFRYQQERRPKYKKNNSNYSRDWNDSEQLDNKEHAAHDEQANVGKDSYDVSQSESQGEQPVYKRNWSDSRTNRRENPKFGNWKERNRYQRNYGQATSAAPTSIQSKSESSSKSDPSTIRQNITPFTHLYNSTAQDAQVMVSIPPPFSKEG